MVKVSGFADEISGNIAEQVAGLEAAGIRYIALRSGAGKNVMAWTDAECDDIRKTLDAAGIGVSEIGSPIGKTPIDEPFEKTQAALARAVQLARTFKTPNIRLFSFYAPKTGPSANILDHRGEVVRRLQALADQVAHEPVVLVLENEAHLYGDYPEQCLDIFTAVRSPKLRMAFDFANFITRKPVNVYEEAWKVLRPFVGHFHVKDWAPGEKHGRVAGQGQGCVKAILADLAAGDYDGFLTVEPHLEKGGPAGGFSGLDNFRRAAEALLALCREVNLAVQ